MAGLTPLIQTRELKTNLLADHARKGSGHVYLHYDESFDALMVLIMPPDTIDWVVHYVDDHVGLLFDDETLEIVGIQVEDFEHSFLPAHKNVAHVWRLSHSDQSLRDRGDLIFAAQRAQPEIASAVVRTARNLPPELTRALA